MLKAITRVASVDTQATWLEFLARHGVELTLAEARQALRQGRHEPRDSSYGLPNLDQRLVLRFARSDMDRVRRWIEDACAAVVEKTGASAVTVEQALLFLCERDTGFAAQADGHEPRRSTVRTSIAEPSPAGAGAERSGSPAGAGASDDHEDDEEAAEAGRSSPRRVSYRAQIVYQRCPDCRRGRVGTLDGFVEVASDEIERHEGCAEAIVIDGPTPPRLRRRILGREAGRCANPRCHNPASHCHHILFRSEGGSTELWNEVGLCRICHALIHAGLLRLIGRADGDLQWIPATSGDALDGPVRRDGPAATALPVLQLAPEVRGAHVRHLGSRESGIADRPGRESAIADSGHGESAMEDSGVRGQTESAIADSGARRSFTSGLQSGRSAIADSAEGENAESVIADSREDATRGTRPVSAAGSLDLEDLALGLRRLGLTAARSRELIGAAAAALSGHELSEAAILRKALGAI